MVRLPTSPFRRFRNPLTILVEIETIIITRMMDPFTREHV